LERRHGGRDPQPRPDVPAPPARPPCAELGPERGDQDRRQGGARGVDRDARRRRAERSRRHPAALADGARRAALAAAARCRASPAPPGQRGEARLVAHRQPGARPATARRHARYRLRPEALPPRRVPRPALLRPHPPLSAGAGAAARRARRVGRGQPSAARARTIELRHLRSPLGRHRRHARRDVAAAPRQEPGDPGRERRGGAPRRMSPDAKEKPAPLAAFRLAGRLAIVVVVLAGAVLLWARQGAVNAEAIAQVIAAYPAAPLVFLAIHIVASLIFFPRTVLAVAAGALFGAWAGALWAALGATIGAVAGFLLARYVNGGLVDLESMQRLGPVLRRAERGGWRAGAVLRLLPVIPHALTNYALGLTRLPLGAYAFGSLVGQLPMAIACADFGAAGERLAAGKAGWLAPTLIGLAVLGLSVLVPKLAARKS